ncbi:MAG: hypothetical protein WBB19_13895 [Desulforhopalus sp.]
MYPASQIEKVLKILARNVETSVQPNLVQSAQIAGELNLTLSETKQILKIMHGMEVIESNMETDYSLITRAGLTSLSL